MMCMHSKYLSNIYILRMTWGPQLTSVGPVHPQKNRSNTNCVACVKNSAGISKLEHAFPRLSKYLWGAPAYQTTCLSEASSRSKVCNTRRTARTFELQQANALVRGCKTKPQGSLPRNCMETQAKSPATSELPHASGAPALPYTRIRLIP